jgi:hypothetical protein
LHADGKNAAGEMRHYRWPHMTPQEGSAFLISNEI